MRTNAVVSETKTWSAVARDLEPRDAPISTEAKPEWALASFC